MGTWVFGDAGVGITMGWAGIPFIGFKNSMFAGIHKTDLKDFQHASFPTISIIEILRIRKLTLFKMMLK